MKWIRLSIVLLCLVILLLIAQFDDAEDPKIYLPLAFLIAPIEMIIVYNVISLIIEKPLKYVFMGGIAPIAYYIFCIYPFSMAEINLYVDHRDTYPFTNWLILSHAISWSVGYLWICFASIMFCLMLLKYNSYFYRMSGFVLIFVNMYMFKYIRNIAGWLLD